MTEIGDLRQQHEVIAEIAATILSRIPACRGDRDANPLALLVGKLNALLRVHLAYEDTLLYPRMIGGGDREVASLAGAFQQELGTLAERFEDFARRWSSNTLIGCSFERFAEEAAELFAMLASRIERENHQLFPLAERAVLRQAA